MTDQTRQYGENLSFIRPDHVNRYMFAAERIQKLRVLDLACGCGYGSWILHGSGNQVVGVDIAQDAIDYAKRYYQGPEYICAKAEDVTGEWDVLVSFETLEHLRDPLPVLRHVKAKRLFASVPNEEMFPFSADKFSDDAYPHQRHYTPEQFEELLRNAGYTVTEKFCQPNKRGEIVPGTEGVFLIYVCDR